MPAPVPCGTGAGAFYFLAVFSSRSRNSRAAVFSGRIVQLDLREHIPPRSVCLVYDHHRPLNTAAREFRLRLLNTAKK